MIEPLVQGNAGMRLCRKEFLQQIRTLCDRYNVLLIFDEVMTGFGRTGELFASIKAETCPDIICLSKGITGGFLPLAVTACKEKTLVAPAGVRLGHAPEWRADRHVVAAAAGADRGAQAGLRSVDLRGNVPTRVDKVRSGEIDAALLALAGLRRLNLESRSPRSSTPIAWSPRPVRAPSPSRYARTTRRWRRCWRR